MLLPDTKSSIRWEQFDRPYLDKTLTAAKVSHTIVNALNDPQKMAAQADQCLANGAKVIIIAPLDAGSASAIEKKAKAAGAQSIDYDRQVEGGTAAVYVSFDGKTVGKLQGACRRRRPQGERPVQQEARRRLAVGWPDRRQLVPLQERRRRRS